MNEESIENKIKDIDVGIIKDTFLDFIVPLIGLAVTAGLFFLYIKPTYIETQKLKTEIDAQSSVLEKLNTKAATLSKMKDYNTVLQEDADLVEKLYASESNVPQLLDQLHQIATNAGMGVDRLNYSYSGAASAETADATAEVRSEDVSGIVNVAMTVTGNYDQMVVFMQEVEKAARLAYVTTFRFGRSTAEDQGEAINVNVNVDSPYMYVQSIAVTDDPVTLDITSPAFVSFMNKVKEYRYYEFLNPNITAEEVEVAEEAAENEVSPFETNPVESPTPTEQTGQTPENTETQFTAF